MAPSEHPAKDSTDPETREKQPAADMPDRAEIPDRAGVPDQAEAPPWSDVSHWSARADAAGRSVTGNFGHSFLFLPGTHIAAVTRSEAEGHPGHAIRDVRTFLHSVVAFRNLAAVRSVTAINNLIGPWHFWWQAQYLDCLVDAAHRHIREGRPAHKLPYTVALGSRLLRTVRLRNAFRYTNNFYDDMAWLGLAALRLRNVADTAGPRPSAADRLRRRTDQVRDVLAAEFEEAADDVLGGGVYWSRQRDFKNTPATAPVALFFARTGRTDKAQELVDWLGSRLFDNDRGLYLDGLRIRGSEEILESGVYTYNQGPVLGALLELGGEANLSRAADLVAAVERRLCPTPGSRALRCDGTGDGGLFTGILARYLALAAQDARLPASTRDSAGSLVTETAEALWSGRSERKGRSARSGSWLIFPTHPTIPAAISYPAGAAVELSTQLQAWMTLEAAASIS